MIAVVESGSTKADWMLIDENGEVSTTTKGFNPYFHSDKDILVELSQNELLQKTKEQIEQIYFYGAGCSSVELNKIIENGLQQFFKSARIKVDHDLSACAYSCYNGRKEIACILGTGSNSCYYDGNQVSEVIPSVGHLLGDEGSGTYFGKKLLADFLYQRLPTDLSNSLKEIGLDKKTIIDNVYRKPDPNVYIASFMPLFAKYRDLDYVQKVIMDGFQVFIDIHVKCYKDYKDCEVNFVGSISSVFENELKEVCERNQIKVGVIIRKPLERLVKFHEKYELTAE